ncbi:MAG: DUF4476 domain-containing protein [Flavipsychrobacter sp.]
MKKASIFLLVFLLSVSQVLAAERMRSAIKIRFNDNRPITISIDGRNYDRHGKSLTLGNLPAGWHNIRVYEFIEYRKGGGRAKLIYTGSVRVKPGVMMYCVVDANTRRMRIRTEDISDLYVDYDNANSVDENVPPKHDKPTDERVNRSDEAVSMNDIKELETLVKGKVTDTDKLKMLKRALKDERYYVMDVKTMMTWLSFESSRLDFAKWSYNKVLNPESYWKLDDAFNFSSSTDELHDYIKKQR